MVGLGGIFASVSSIRPLVKYRSHLANPSPLETEDIRASGYAATIGAGLSNIASIIEVSVIHLEGERETEKDILFVTKMQLIGSSVCLGSNFLSMIDRYRPSGVTRYFASILTAADGAVEIIAISFLSKSL
jgi:hypothetical protein